MKLITLQFETLVVYLYQHDIYRDDIKGGLKVTDFIILGFLMDKDMSGYDIKNQMSVSTSYFIDSSFGSIYPSLKRLESKQFICSKEVVQKTKLKILYSINEKGKEEFLRWLTSPIAVSKTSIVSVLSKVFFFKHLVNSDKTVLIKSYINELIKLKNNLLDLKSKIAAHADKFEMSTLNFGLDYYDFIVNWYQKNISLFNSEEE